METETKIRSFIALAPGERVRGELARAIEKLRRSEAKVTWVPTSNLHLSLHFLGELTPEQFTRVGSGLMLLAARLPCFDAAVSGVGVFGAPRRPRVIWAGVEAVAELSRLHAETRQFLDHEGIATERRPFRGHITLGRVRASRNSDALLELVRTTREREFGVLHAAEVGLYRSVLKPTGAEYSREYVAPLRG